VNERSLRAVLVDQRSLDRQGPRLVQLLAAALDGSGPAIAPLDAGLPRSQLEALLSTFAPDEIEDAGGVTSVRSSRSGISPETAVILGTSGSTGEPKGVRLSGNALLHSARASMARIQAGPGERWLCCLPVTHVAGLQVLVRSVLSGTDPVFAEKAEPQTIAASGAEHISLVPTQLQRLESDFQTLNAFKSVLLGGAAAAEALVSNARAQKVPIVTTYGMTETCGGCVYDGLPLDGVGVEIRDGRIWISGPVLFTGYWGEPDQASWFQTGDLGRLDDNGRLTVSGRADDVINTGGHKVLPAEVAAAVAACPGVKDVAVVGQQDPEWGERVVAVVVAADPGDPPTLRMLRMHVKERLPRYAAPSRVVLVDAVPMLPSGKHDLARLRQQMAHGWEQIEPSSVTN
jgi:O-succinylbenzoic acid--CoA ligase